MFDFLKTCGQGLLYLILSPLILAGLLVYGVYSFFVFFFMFFKRIIMFFSGDDLKDDMKIDKIAKLQMKKNKEEEEVKQAISPTPIIEKTTTTVVQPIIIQTDENGVLKNVKVVNQNNQNQLQQDVTSIPSIEENKTEEEEK